MGVSCMKSCYTNMDWRVKAPNPSPSNYTVKKIIHFTNTTYMYVKYHGCTNFEGAKVMVYLGRVVPKGDLDPHFQEGGNGPIARFEPSIEGMESAKAFAKGY